MGEAIHEEVFGHLTWDAQLGCWLGGINWTSALYVEVAIWQPENDLVAGLRMAREGLAWLLYHEPDVREWVAGELLDVYNDAWRDQEEPISVEEFTRRIKLLWIGFGDDGSLLVSYDAGDMFGGHVIDADCGADRSFQGARLVG